MCAFRRLSLLFAIVASAAACVAADVVGQEKAIGIATDYVRGLRWLDLGSLKVSAERRSEPPEDALAATRPRLMHRVFWLVSFAPRKPQLGGGYAVYVAADTGEILGSRGYR
jgi:hypothetical protein